MARWRNVALLVVTLLAIVAAGIVLWQRMTAPDLDWTHYLELALALGYAWALSGVVRTGDYGWVVAFGLGWMLVEVLTDRADGLTGLRLITFGLVLACVVLVAPGGARRRT